MTQIIGYIVSNEFFGEPLELCDNKKYYPWSVLLRGDVATVFTTRKAASAAIEKTIEWAEIGKEEPPEWAEKYQYKIWRLCPTAAIAEARGQSPRGIAKR